MVEYRGQWLKRSLGAKWWVVTVFGILCTVLVPNVVMAEERVALSCNVRNEARPESKSDKLAVYVIDAALQIEGVNYPITERIGTRVSAELATNDEVGRHIDMITIDSVTGDVSLWRYTLDRKKDSDVILYIERNGGTYYEQFELRGACQSVKPLF